MNFEKWIVKLFSIFNKNENDLTFSFFIFQVLRKINWHSGTRIHHDYRRECPSFFVFVMSLISVLVIILNISK